MKALKFFSTMLILLTMCIPVTSCSDDDEDEPAPVTTPSYTIDGTTWVYQETSTDEDGDQTIYSHTLQFTGTTAIWKYELIFKYSFGGTSTYPMHENKYTYTYSTEQNTAVLTPTNDNETSNLAILTAKVTPGVQLVLWNTSKNENVATFLAK
ncbi:MAG: hypothetical protein IJY31_06840 [Muribaculaceae bacterium]|nr:hypothetical protein [Muribaculaceae bacterium]